MNTLHLKYAVEVERAGSITQAADNLFMAQPNLSKAIRELEEGLGITIFERTPRGVVPTQRGVEFLRRAKEILGVV
jgi:DNA-binding transcriptional LysR family regulator